MALAFGNFQRMLPRKGGWRCGYVDITLDDAYAGGGWPVTAANLGLSTLHMLVPPGAAIASSRIFPLGWNQATGKIIAGQGSTASNAGLKEIDAGDLNGVVIRCYYEGW